MQKCCHAESHFLKTTGVAEGEEREEGQWRWRCTVSPGDPLQLRTGSLEMNETPGHTDSPGPGGAGKPESRGELGGFLSPPQSIHPAREGPRGLRDRCSARQEWTARRPTLTAARAAALHSAPRLRRPGRAALPFRFREPGRRDRPSGCRHARAPARRHGRRRRRLRFAPRSCDGSRRGPKDLKALRSPEPKPTCASPPCCPGPAQGARLCPHTLPA